ncbi:tyrosine-protein kinase domain-containing protein [Methylorubrum salsuginis]|uniref:Chain length determinant protein n=1 Tax=Methylorubrum salsuginis TaxID=414703 RepID=A0A1I3YQH7_9HYPH|nr:tyrosine-protein kinase domain-containing protein [Methylorubrum salsuginis]SFK33466.1 Chain length determinant protein [Methylorubrum salsuginis]
MNYTPFFVRPDDPHDDARAGREPIDPGGPGHDLETTLIGDLIAAIRRRAVPLALWVLVCTAAGVAYVLIADPEFRAAAQIALEPRVRLPPGADAAAAAAATAPTLDSAQAESQVQVIQSARNLRYVFDTLGLDTDPAYAEKPPGFLRRTLDRLLALLPLPAPPPLTPEEKAMRAREIAFQNFSDRVQVKRLGQSYVLEVSFRGLTPQDTARLTNAIAAAYIRDQVLVRAASDQRGTEFLQGRIALIQAQRKAADEAVATGVITDFQFPDSDARIVGAALRPLVAAYPQTKLILLLGAFFGLVSGVGGIAVLHSFDRTVRSPAQIRRVFGLECFLVPRFKGGRLMETATPKRRDAAFALALSQLRTVLFSSEGASRSVSIGFVACRKGTGCSTLSAHLARLVSASGDRVVLVDADLREPELTRRFAPQATAGLEDFALSCGTDADLPEVPLDASLSFVPAVAAGRTAHPDAFLGTQALRAALARFGGKRPLVLDLPPLDASADAQAIGPMLTGIVLVAHLDRTKLDELADAIRALGSTHCRVLGIVLNDPAQSRTAWRRIRASA